jgi:hypothetical protein
MCKYDCGRAKELFKKYAGTLRTCAPVEGKKGCLFFQGNRCISLSPIDCHPLRDHVDARLQDKKNENGHKHKK